MLTELPTSRDMVRDTQIKELTMVGYRCTSGWVFLVSIAGS